MAPDDGPTEQEPKHATSQDISLLVVYVDNRLRKLERRFERSLFWAVVVLVILLAPDFAETVAVEIINAIAMVFALAAELIRS